MGARPHAAGLALAGVRAVRHPGEAAARLRALAALAAAQRRLRRRGLAACLADAAPVAARGRDPDAAERRVARVARSLHAVGPLVPGSACLAAALAARDLLARDGIACALRIGVARGEGGALAAHAWIEVDGRPRVGAVRDLARYRPLPDPAAAARVTGLGGRTGSRR